MKYNRENTKKLLQDFLEKKVLVKGIISNMKGNYEYSKVIIKPLLDDLLKPYFLVKNV